MQGASIEEAISRDPKELYEWIVELNQKSGSFAALSEDTDKRRDVKALCFLFSLKEISFHDFLYHVEDLDIFYHKDLGPLMANFPTFGLPPPSSFPQEAVDNLMQDKSFFKLF